jgi:hypothetical protein
MTGTGFGASAGPPIGADRLATSGSNIVSSGIAGLDAEHRRELFGRFHLPDATEISEQADHIATASGFVPACMRESIVR